MLTVNAASSPTDFDDKDEISSTYAEAVNVLSALQIIQGDDLGNFNPKKTIRRSEVATLIYRIATSVDDTQAKIFKDYPQFTDVDPEYWFAGYVNYCGNAQYIKGKTPTTFDPWANVTGYEVLAMILRVVGYDQNGEFTGDSWRVRTASTARDLGILKNISEGTLGQAATREQVAEMLFQAMQVPTVKYNMLERYTPDNVLIADNADNRAAYANAIKAGKLQLPLYGNLLYSKFDIVGKAEGLTYDKFGRPSVAWVKDADVDNTVGLKHGADTVAGRAGKYIPNSKNGEADWEQDKNIGTADEEAVITIALTPVKVYTDGVTECQLSKDVAADSGIYWGAITEVLNGNATTGTTGIGQTQTLDNSTPRTGRTKLDALHTTVDYIGATGRTTEIYKLDEKVCITKATGAIQTSPTGSGEETVNKWIFVYYDTLLGEVTKVTPAIKDSNGHTIKAATATVEVGNNAGAALETIELETSAYEKGELILVQTYGGAAIANDEVDSPERAPLAPDDVPDTALEFKNGSTVYAKVANKKPTTERVTIKATVGARDFKMGIIGTDGKKYMASNTFLAARNGGTNVTVLEDWYDVPVPTKGITNNMIGRTYDIVLDQNGYIVGMDEVATVNSSVGVITGMDSKRISTGKYVSEVEAYMADGSTQTFEVARLTDVKATASGSSVGAANIDLKNAMDAANYGEYGYFTSSTSADDAWKDTFAPATGDDTGMYGAYVGIGSLVKFAQVKMPDGKTCWAIDDCDLLDDADTPAALTDKTSVATEVGTNYVSLVAPTQVKAGATNTLLPATKVPMLDDDSVVFVTEYDYRYNTGDDNEGSNVNKEYEVYEGFKNLPTVEVGTASNIMYQRLDKNPEYFLIGKIDACNDYVIKAQSKIAVDESYLLLSRGATYDEYSEYNVLKDGELTTLKVSNGNTKLNEDIEKTLTGIQNNENQLIVVTGTNRKGYVTSIKDTYEITQSGSPAERAMLAENSLANSVQIAPDGNGNALDETEDGIRVCGSSVLTLVKGTGGANGFLTLDDECKVKLVNRDLKEVYDITLSEAIRYANGVDKGATKDGTLPSHGLVFELNEYGYVSTLYVIDDWTEVAT